MAASRSRSQPDSYHFTVVYDGCLPGDDKTDSIKLSYDFVEKLQEKAEKRGILCFLPHLTTKGGHIELRELYYAMEKSEHVILVMTEGYLEKMRTKKLSDSQNDPDLLLQYIHYNIIDYKISANTDDIIVVPIYLQTRKKEISLGAHRSIQFRKKEDWEDEENWEKIWSIIPEDIQPSVLIGSTVSSQGSSEPDAGESDGPVLEYMSVSEMERYCSNNSLGKSRFGEVFEGLEKYRQKEIAVEVCQKAREEHELQFIKERTIGYIRHPFLLPLYAVAATPEKIYLMYPYNMERRDLDHVLRNKSSELERHHRCRITYQVCGGLQYLHSPIERENVTIRNSILHMNIKPSHILLDQDWNARLRFHGPTAEVTSVDHSDQIYQDPDFLSSQGEYRKEYDVFSVGVVMWRLMGAEEEFLKEFRTEDGKFKLEEVTKKVIIKAQEALPAVWPICPEGESNYTTKFAKLALECVKPIDDRINLDDLRCLIKMNILDAGDKIDTFIKPSGTLCCKCNLNNAAKDLHPRVNCSEPRKGEHCGIFCQGCLTDHYRNPLYCPTHGFTQPPIGHDDSFAVLVGGFDKADAEIFQNDIVQFKAVLINHNIMGFRESQVYMVLCKETSKGDEVKQKIEEYINEIKEKTSGHPEVRFVFFYSGHGTEEGLNLPGDESFQITKGELQKMFEDLNASEKLIILDCCFAASNRMERVSSTQGPRNDSQINDENSQMVGKGKVSETVPDGDAAAGNTASSTPNRYADKGRDPRDSDNLCHYEWWSCAENQSSLRNRDDKLSVFTKHLVNGLKSGHKCGLQGTTDQCKWCELLRNKDAEYILPEILHSYVSEHVKEELADYKIQQPMNNSSYRRPMKIAYYNKKDLCQEVVVFTPKETLVIKLTDQVEAKLSAIKDYIAGEMKGHLPSDVTGEQLCLMDEVLQKEIVNDTKLQQSLDRNFPLHCCLKTAR